MSSNHCVKGDKVWSAGVRKDLAMGLIDVS